MNIHPTAIIDPKAELADDVEVQAYTLIGPGVRIGAGTVVGPHCVLDGDTTIGKHNRIFSGAQIGILSQDLKHLPDLVGKTVIGDGNMFREHVTVSACTMSSYDDNHRVTSIGSNCMFMAYSHVAHDCHVGDRVVMANCASLAGHVEVENGAILGGLTAVHQECVVGTLAFVGGGVTSSKDVPPFMMVQGTPARCCGPNMVGLKRNGVPPERRALIKRMYRIVYRSHLNTNQALHEIERVIEECDERNHFLEFFRNSIRGVMS